MPRNYWIIIVIAVVVFVGWQLAKPQTPEIPSNTPPPPSTSTPPEQGSLSEPATPSTGSENIRVTSPKPGDTVTSPFIVSGEARVFENQLTVRISNSAGTKLIDQPVTARAKDAGEFGPFKVNMHYQFKNTKDGFVEVFNHSAKDGSIENMVKIPVKFE